MYSKVFIPGVTIAGINVGGLTKQQAVQKIKPILANRLAQPVTLTYQNQTYTLDLSSLSTDSELNKAINKAFTIGHTGSLPQKLTQVIQTTTNGSPVDLNIYIFSYQKIATQIDAINAKIKKDPTPAILQNDQAMSITPSVDGIEIDKQKLSQQIEQYLLSPSSTQITIPTKTMPPAFTTQTAEKAKQALLYVQEHPIELTYDDQTWTIDKNLLRQLINTSSSAPGLSQINIDGQNLQVVSAKVGDTVYEDKDILFDKQKLSIFIQNIATSINRPPQDAKFTFDGKRVNQFEPGEDGRSLDNEQTTQLIKNAVYANNSNPIALPVATVAPQIATAAVNNYGIEERIGQGLSDFSGSIENRIYNLGLASSRVNGILVAPGEEFSFVKAVGDISGASGYKPAYVIKEGRTVLDDGGGVCQVSTTLFRAALNAGLPITARTGHAYRVHYYENAGFAPGIDATIFSPTVDFRFKNDTPSYILIQTTISGMKLTVDIFGKSDGRVANVTTPVILNQTPPPPELRQDDPTLPKGTVKQVDWAAWGANVVFKRTVTRNGQEIINESWRTNYKPWQAVYLVGTKEG
jgi:vancomycin resistance protein YoaR